MSAAAAARMSNLERYPLTIRHALAQARDGEAAARQGTAP